MSGCKLFVGNLTDSVTVGQIKALFSKFGSVRQVVSIEGKGFGLVEMSHPSEAISAQRALHGFVRDGRCVVCLFRQSDLEGPS